MDNQSEERFSSLLHLLVATRGGAAVVETLHLLGAGNTVDIVCFDEHSRRCDCFFHAVVEQRRLLLVVGGVVNWSELLQRRDKPPC